jgi:hypothetical protein
MPIALYSDRQRLDQLRHRLAQAERPSIVVRIQADLNAFAEGAAEDLLIECADLQDRCAAKAERLGGAPAPKQSRKLQLLQRRSAPPAALHQTALIGMTIRMRVSEWVLDEFGNRSRAVWNMADGPVPPSPSASP